jgi:hypothetical protein
MTDDLARRRSLLTAALGFMASVVPFAFGSVGISQSGDGPASIGADGITRVLTSQKEWTLYWDRGVPRPRLGAVTTDRSPSAILEFMRVGPRVVGYASNDQVHHMECEFDVAVKEDGFTFTGCWGSDKAMAYDPTDTEYPFKGRVDGTMLWLAPSR